MAGEWALVCMSSSIQTHREEGTAEGRLRHWLAHSLDACSSPSPVICQHSCRLSTDRERSVGSSSTPSSVRLQVSEASGWVSGAA